MLSLQRNISLHYDNESIHLLVRQLFKQWKKNRKLVIINIISRIFMRTYRWIKNIRVWKWIRNVFQWKKTYSFNKVNIEKGETFWKSKCDNKCIYKILIMFISYHNYQHSLLLDIKYYPIKKERILFVKCISEFIK